MIVFLAFLAGIVTALSPCVLPLLPVLLASSLQKGRLYPWGVLGGFVVSFSVITLLLAALVSATGIQPDSLRTVSGIILLICGLVLALPFLSHWFEARTSAIATIGARVPNRDGLWGGALLGSGLGLAWTPCVGPIMASVITLALSQSLTGGAVVTTLAFSLGTSLPMAAIIFGGRAVLQRMGLSSQNLQRLRMVFGLLLIIAASLILTGIDRQIQIWLLSTFPGWEQSLTEWEPVT